MAGVDRTEAANIFPAVKYKDAPAAIDWIVGAFGFEKRLVVPNEDGTVAHSELKLGPGVVMLYSGPQGGPTGDPVRDKPFGLYVYVEDVDAHYHRAKAAGARIVRELVDQDHGGRGYSSLDPEGNVWSFGSYYPGD